MMRRTFPLTWAATTVWLLILLYIVFFSTLTVRRHDAFQSAAFDLGNYDQAVWNTRHGRPLAMTNIEGLTNRLGTHVEPILVYVSLLYYIWSDPRALLLLQTAVIALGAWPVYKLARHALLSRRRGDDPAPGCCDTSAGLLPVVFAAAYLMFPALQSANFCDFHALSLAPTFFLLALYGVETERWGSAALFATLTALCKEDMPLLVAGLGLYAALARHHWRAGAALTGLALAWFLVSTGWILPHFDPSRVSPLAGRYAYLGNGPLGIAAGLMAHPGRAAGHLFTSQNLAYLCRLLAPIAFLSLLAPQLLVLALPSLAVNLLSTEWYMHELEAGYYYGAPLAPIVVVSAAYGASWVVRRLPRVRFLPAALGALVLLATLCYHRAHGLTPLAADAARYWNDLDAHDRLGHEMARAIPPDASVGALPHLNPHASQRQAVYVIDAAVADGTHPLRQTDYLWLDVTNAWPLEPQDVRNLYYAALARGYGIQQAVDGWLLLRLGAPQTALPGTFYTFARPLDPRPLHPQRVQFALDGRPALEFLGFDRYRRFHGIEFVLYWRALQPLPPDLHLVAECAGTQAPGETIPLALVSPLWFPPARWPVDEIVSTQTLSWQSPLDCQLTVDARRGDEPMYRLESLPVPDADAIYSPDTGLTAP